MAILEDAIMTEQQLQADCFRWFHNEPKLFHLRRLLHCNMNNQTNAIAGNRAKAVGVMPGTSDLELILQDTVAFIELKLPGNTQSDEQIDFEKKVKALGHLYFLIYSLEEFKELIWTLIGR